MKYFIIYYMQGSLWSDEAPRMPVEGEYIGE